MQVEVETGEVLSQMGAVHDERAFRQQEEVIAPFRGPQGSRHAETERPRAGRQHSTAGFGQDRAVAAIAAAAAVAAVVAAQCRRIVPRPADARHAADRRGPAALPHRGSARDRRRVIHPPADRPRVRRPRPRTLNPDAGDEHARASESSTR